MFKIHLKVHNGQYICAEGGGGREIVANRPKANEWETFMVHDENGGRLEGGDVIYLAAYNGKYLCAEGGGGREVVANRDNPSIWEKFTIEKVSGSGEIKNGDKISIRCFNGQYLCAEGGGGREIVANRPKVDVWETFIIEIDGNTPILPIRIKEYTRIGTAKHMETIATLSANGNLSVQTTTWTTWKAKGFTGGVVIAVGDEQGNLLYQSQVHSFGVDGEWIGRSRRTDFWQENIDPNLLKNVSQIRIIHFHNPKNRLIKILKETAKTIAELYAALEEIFEE